MSVRNFTPNEAFELFVWSTWRHECLADALYEIATLPGGRGLHTLELTAEQEAALNDLEWTTLRRSAEYRLGA